MVALEYELELPLQLVEPYSVEHPDLATVVVIEKFVQTLEDLMGLHQDVEQANEATQTVLNALLIVFSLPNILDLHVFHDLAEEIQKLSSWSSQKIDGLWMGKTGGKLQSCGEQMMGKLLTRQTGREVPYIFPAYILYNTVKKNTSTDCIRNALAVLSLLPSNYGGEMTPSSEETLTSSSRSFNMALNRSSIEGGADFEAPADVSFDICLELAKLPPMAALGFCSLGSLIESIGDKQMKKSE
nr:hypothetical protein Iba_chr11fCG13660 [Ipomoea batatas]